MPTLRLTFALLVLVAALALSGCAVTDTADSVKSGADTVKAGSDTANYLASVQPQLEAYGAALSGISLSGQLDATKAARFVKARATLEQVRTELDGIQASEDFQEAHAQLISATEASIAALSALAKATVDKSQPAFEAARTKLTDAQTQFAAAMQEITTPLTEQLEKNG